MIAMVFDPALSFGGFIGGLAVGFTGMGGGAILTPMLVLIFNVPASAAIGTDLVASLVMKPVSGFIHLKRGTVRLDIVKWLCFGSVPGAAMGAIFVGRLSDEVKENFLLRGLGVVLLLAAGAMSWRAIKSSSHTSVTEESVFPVRPLPTLILGLFGGFIVSLTSVGSGSLMIVVLTVLYPALRPTQLVGTDLVQAIPLVATAAIGHLIVGDVGFSVTTSLIIGAVPGAYFGAQMSSKAADKMIRPILILILIASGVKFLVG